MVQVAEQPSPDVGAPLSTKSLSQVSPFCTMPSPHRPFWQRLPAVEQVYPFSMRHLQEQPSPSSTFPSSHSSPYARIPSPHAFAWHFSPAVEHIHDHGAPCGCGLKYESALFLIVAGGLCGFQRFFVSVEILQAIYQFGKCRNVTKDYHWEFS